MSLENDLDYGVDLIRMKTMLERIIPTLPSVA
jgi:hypothetical protein